MKDEIVLYQPNETIQLEVHLKDETVWLTQQQIADLFGVKQPAISKHIANIYKSGELDEEGTYSILEYMGHDGKQLYTAKAYNLDMILSVGYRVNSTNATRFRQWANRVLKDYMLRGYAVNQRLLNIENQLVSQQKQLAQHQEQIDFFVRTNMPPVEQFDRSHDRFLCVDETVYHIGASLKDLGKKWFAFSRMEQTTDELLSKM